MAQNKAPGVRARQALQDIKALAQGQRVAIQRCKSESVRTYQLDDDKTEERTREEPKVGKAKEPEKRLRVHER